MDLTLQIKVVPSSGRSSWDIDKSGTLKCYLKSEAQKGKANQELIKRIAKLVGLAQNEVQILQGATSRKKLVRITKPLTYEQFLDLLGLKIEFSEKGSQQKLF